MIIPGFSKYNIEADGVVTKVSTGVVVEPHIVRSGSSCYARVSLRSDDGHVRVYNVLTILALAYLGKPIHEGIVIAKDGNNLNATLDNVVVTTKSEIATRSWRNGSMANRRKRERCYNESSIEMVYDAMQAYGRPVTMAELSCDLQVPYNTVRYSMMALCKRLKVRKTEEGFEVIL